MDLNYTYPASEGYYFFRAVRVCLMGMGGEKIFIWLSLLFQLKRIEYYVDLQIGILLESEECKELIR
jgi:hypothetical protein